VERRTQVLVVRHPPERSRIPGYLDAAFERFRARAPELHAQLHFQTPEDPPPALDTVRAAIFFLSDPLREHDPAGFTAAAALAARLRAAGARVVNAPEALSHSIKSVQARRWLAAGIPTPAALRFESRAEMAARAAQLGWPVLLRADEGHAQIGIRVCRSQAELDAIPDAELPLPGALSPLVDVRAGFRARAPRDPRARFFHKKRALVLDGRVVTKHVLFAGQPVVSAKTSRFRIAAKRPWAARLDPWLRACVREDLAYWRHGDAHADLLRRALAALELDFAAIDYSDLADGAAVLWEANPHPYLPTEPEIMLGRWRRAPERMASYHDAVGGLLADALADTARRRVAPAAAGAVR
jgi:hypothetical protein